MIYMLIVFLQVVIAIIPGEPLEIAGGYAFGAIEGTLLYLGAAVLGSLVVFCWSADLGSDCWKSFLQKTGLNP